MSILSSKVGRLGVMALGLAVTFISPAVTHASSPTQGVPDQASCDSSGQFTYAWQTMGIARPQVASLSVDGETVPDILNPPVGSLGVTICAGTALGNRTGLSIYKQVDSMTRDFDLTGATTPVTHTPMTSTSKIKVTITNFGDLAPYFSFALVHGTVSQWTTANLGTASASLIAVITPTRTPYGNGPDFGGCTATPPNCNAAKSDVDALSASMDFTLNQNVQASAEFAGSYFALTGAMGGFVKAEHADDGTPYLVASLGAPHTLADGVTRNVGSMQAFLPTAVINSELGLTGSFSATDLVMSRTESGTTDTAPFTFNPVDGGAIIDVPGITFSSPTYTIKKVAAIKATPKAVGLPNTGHGADTDAGSTAPWYVLSGLMLVGAVVTGRKRASRDR